MSKHQLVQLTTKFLDIRQMYLYLLLALRPVIAFLPAFLAYRVACLRGDWRYRSDPHAREGVMRALTDVLGDQLSPRQRADVTRDYFRLRSCEGVDMVRLAGRGKALTRLVEIRGLEHIQAALAAGKGAILCSAHFGSFDCGFSVIGAHGFPITVIGRWPSRFSRPIDQFFFQHLIRMPVEHHRHRPNIQPRGEFATAAQAAALLRHNELIALCLDPPPRPADRRRAVPVDFLNGQALLLPGAATIAQLIGAPMLMMFMRRSADWRHQILEILPPLQLDGDTMTAFKRCLAVVEAAIRENPAHWYYWHGLSDLVKLGLLPEHTLQTYEQCVVTGDWWEE